jgi:hypothetical protein
MTVAPDKKNRRDTKSAEEEENRENLNHSDTKREDITAS